MNNTSLGNTGVHFESSTHSRLFVPPELILDLSIDERYPTGALWVLNRVYLSPTFVGHNSIPKLQQAKLLRYTGDPEAAIKALQEGLSPDRKETFPQADIMVCPRLFL
jgi:hypothetical protein